MDGRALAAKVRAAVKEEVAELGELGLATVLVGDDPASHLYITRKHEAAEEVGMRTIDHRLPPETSEEAAGELLRDLNADHEGVALPLQQPVPRMSAPRCELSGRLITAEHR